MNTNEWKFIITYGERLVAVVTVDRTLLSSTTLRWYQPNSGKAIACESRWESITRHQIEHKCLESKHSLSSGWALPSERRPKGNARKSERKPTLKEWMSWTLNRCFVTNTRYITIGPKERLKSYDKTWYQTINLIFETIARKLLFSTLEIHFKCVE